MTTKQRLKLLLAYIKLRKKYTGTDKEILEDIIKTVEKGIKNIIETNLKDEK